MLILFLFEKNVFVPNSQLKHDNATAIQTVLLKLGTRVRGFDLVIVH